jgi:hypothetical protein
LWLHPSKVSQYDIVSILKVSNNTLAMHTIHTAPSSPLLYHLTCIASDCENNRLELIVLWSTTFVAATGILFFAPTASTSGANIEQHWIDAAAFLNVIIIAFASVVIVTVMIVSAIVVLYEEDQKQVEGTDLYRNAKVFSAIFKPDISAGLFDIGDCTFKMDDEDDTERTEAQPVEKHTVPDSVSSFPLFPALLTNQGPAPSSENIRLERVSVMNEPPGNPDVLYRGVRVGVTWLNHDPHVHIATSRAGKNLSPSDPLVGAMDVAFTSIGTDRSTKQAFVGGTVTLDNGWAFLNPNGGSIGVAIRTLFETSQRIDPESCVHSSPDEVLNDKEPFKDTYQKDLIGALADRAIQRALDEGLLRQNVDGWLHEFPLYRNTTNHIDAFLTLFELEKRSSEEIDDQEQGGGDVGIEMGGSETRTSMKPHSHISAKNLKISNSSRKRVSSSAYSKSKRKSSNAHSLQSHADIGMDEDDLDVDELCNHMAKRLGFVACEDSSGGTKLVNKPINASGLSERMDMVDMKLLFDSMDEDGNGNLSRSEIETALSAKSIRSRQQRALCLIVDTFRKMLPRQELVLRLQTALYSLYLFTKRQMFTRQRQLCGVWAWGKHFQTIMTGNPNHSTFAQIAKLDVLRTSDKLDRSGPLEFAAIWLDKKATDTERMLLGGFFDVVSRLKRPALVMRPQVRNVSEPVSSPSLPPVPPVSRVSLSRPSARPLTGGQSAVHDRSGLASMNIPGGTSGADAEDRDAAWVEMQDLPQRGPQLVVQPAASEASLLDHGGDLPTPPIPDDLPSGSNSMSPTAEKTYRNL